MKSALILGILVFFCSTLLGDLSLPNIFTDHMVLQRDQQNPVWGKAKPGEKITVQIAGQSHAAKTGKDGKWRVKLDPLPAGGPHVLKVKGSNTVTIKDVLVGEVWFCSGQSNMEWSVNISYNAEVEKVSANYPQIRLLTVQKLGTQTPAEDITGQWEICTPESVGDFSAVGYFFGRRLHNALNVPIGLIDNAWGGSAAEAWIPRETLEKDSRYDDLLQHWDEQVAANPPGSFEKKLEDYQKWVKSGRPDPQQRRPRDILAGQHRPANIYNGMLAPTVGYGMRGVIWYQGETNGGRSYQYTHLFPLLIQSYRDLWQQGDFPFYYVQLADFQDEVDEPGDSTWAELRQAQTMTMDVVPNAGQAVIIDVGEGRDIHPRDKQTVANRLARWALANDYGFDIAYQSPRYKSMEVKGNKVRITLDHVSDGGLWSFDVKEVIGFSIAGKDQKFVWAEAKIVSNNEVEIWSDDVSKPVAVRYGWAQNPRLNLFDRNGLPVTPFRTDDWPWVTANNTK
ncbi:MAG: sialate O-acetylesterase [Puniceicoccaceae bacterium]